MKRAACAAAALALAAGPADAHLVQTGFGAFYDGVAHLVLTPADLLVVLAFGLLAGLRGQAGARAVLVALPLAWVAGGAAAAARASAGDLAWPTAASAALAGVLVALDARLHERALLGLALFAGALHGFADGAALQGESARGLVVLGAAAACFCAVALLGAWVVSLRAPWTRVAVRVGGSWIAASGVLMLGWLVRCSG